jgi:pyruvate kinase
VLGLTASPAVARRLGLSWGIVPRVIEADDLAQPRGPARRVAVEEGLAGPGQTVLLLSGFGKNEPTVTVLPV